MNDHPLQAVREARERISAAVDHDPKRLIERCRQIEQEYKGRVITAPKLETQEDVGPTVPASPVD